MKIRYIIFAAIALAGSVSCNDAVHKYDDVTSEGRLFINEAIGTAKSTSFIIPDAGMSVNVTPRISKPLDEDLEVTVYINEAALNEFNARNNTSHVMLPADGYRFEEKTVIRAGKVVANPVQIKLNALTYDQNNSGFIYALPVSVMAKDDKMKVLESSDTYIIAAQPVMKLNVPELTSGCIIFMPLAEDYLLPSWTFELMFNASSFPDGNKTSWIASAIGYYAQGGTKIIQDGFMWRLGDSGGGTPSNIINGMISRSGKKVSEISLNPKVWYHIAVVCDNGPITLYINGEVAYTGASGYAATQFFADQGIRLAGENRGGTSIGSNYYRFSQVRFWETARTVDQLNNNRYAVPTDTPGLLGYWKLDDATPGQATVPRDSFVGLIEESTPMITIDTHKFKDGTGKQPDAYVDKGASSIPFKYSSGKRVEVGYDWDGKLLQ